jgi:hypothetical protein
MSSRKRAIAMIMASMIMAGIVTTAASHLSVSSATFKGAQGYYALNRAFWLAEAGLTRGRKAFIDDDWTGWNKTVNVHTINETLGEGTYSTTVTRSGSGITVVATGNLPGTVGIRAAQRTLSMTAPIRTFFNYALFGKRSFSMVGSAATDSYDSRIGKYKTSGNRFTNGDVGTTGPVLSLDGNPTVGGDVNLPPTGELNTKPWINITGSVYYTAEDMYESVTVDPSLTSAPSGGSYNLVGNKTATLAEGNYRFDSFHVGASGRLTIQGGTNIFVSGDFDLDGAGLINISGPVTFYIEGDIDIGGSGIMNKTSKPSDLVMFGTRTYNPSDLQQVNIRGNADLYAGIYAPDADIKIVGSGDLYGAAVGSDVRMTGAGDVHYDEALAEYTPDSDSAGTFRDWREI